MFILAANKFNPSPGISPSISITSVPCPSPVQNVCSTDIPSLTKPHSSEYILFATYFDIGIIRTLFSPSWLTDGYLWCLEYLQKRITDISDEILSDHNISSHHVKSLSISQINNLDDRNYYQYLKTNYLNEQITNNIIEKQYMMTNGFNSNKQPTSLLNTPFKYSSRKSAHQNLAKKDLDYFFILKQDRK
jgi:hypothetical protein